MGRRPQSDYVAAAKEVFADLGVDTLPTKQLVNAAQERGLVVDEKWTYHNMTRKLRDSEEFNTSRRGHVALAETGAVGEVAGEVELQSDTSVVVTSPEAELAEEVNEETSSDFVTTDLV